MVGPGRRYRVTGVLGKGGFGTVYRAEMHDEGDFSKVVALKVLNADAPDIEGMARRLRDEARVLGLLRHRAIVQVDGLVRLDGQWTVVMELVDGVDLRAIVTGYAPVPERAAMEVVAEVAAALNAAWTRAGPSGRPLNLIHRDIKPANIQLTSGGEVKVLDFGIARADFDTRESETHSVLLGSMNYLAPERFELVNGPAADIYALGATAWELLTGQNCERTSPRQAKHEAVLSDRIAVLERTSAPPAVIDLVRSMLEYEPERRPSARDVERAAGELARTLGGEALRDWAEAVVPAARQAGPTFPADRLSGATLVEQRGSVDDGPAPTPAGPSQVQAFEQRVGGTRAPTPAAARTGGTALWLVGSVAGAVTLATVLVVALGVGWNFYAPRNSSTTTPETVVTATPPEAEPAAAPPNIEPNAAGRAAPAVAPAPDPSPSSPVAEARNRPPAKSAVAATAAPAASSKGTIRVTGDATNVRFVGKSGSFAAGALPAGDYDVLADFGGGEFAAGTLRLGSGATLDVECFAAFVRCKAQ